MTHVVLLGDSVFDNGRYVPPNKDVSSHLRGRLGADARTTLLAIDGSMVEDVSSQVLKVPDDATHLALSAGANDALYQVGVLSEETQTVADALERIGEIRERFAESYRKLLSLLLAFQKPMVLCTIYDPPMFDFAARPAVAPGLSIFNDTILGAAFSEGLPVIETRLVCHEALDFESIIEPSETGGAKIAEALARALGLESGKPRSQVFAI